MLTCGCLIGIYIYKCMWRQEGKYQVPSSLNRNHPPLLNMFFYLPQPLQGGKAGWLVNLRDPSVSTSPPPNCFIFPITLVKIYIIFLDYDVISSFLPSFLTSKLSHVLAQCSLSIIHLFFFVGINSILIMLKEVFHEIVSLSEDRNAIPKQSYQHGFLNMTWRRTTQIGMLPWKGGICTRYQL